MGVDVCGKFILGIININFYDNVDEKCPCFDVQFGNSTKKYK